MTAKEYILSHIWKHTCTDESCSHQQMEAHQKHELWELPSEVFVNACLIHLNATHLETALEVEEVNNVAPL